MVKSQLSQHQNPSDEEEAFKPKSFMIFCLDEEGNIAFEASWGDSLEDVKKFAILYKKISSGEFDAMVLDQLKQQSKTITDGSKKYSTFSKAFKELNKPQNLVIDPTEVELN